MLSAVVMTISTFENETGIKPVAIVLPGQAFEALLTDLAGVLPVARVLGKRIDEVILEGVVIRRG